MEKRKRVELTLAKKIKIIEEVNNGRKYKDIATKYGIGKATISNIMKKKDLFNAITTAPTHVPDRKRMTLSKFPTVSYCYI